MNMEVLRPVESCPGGKSTMEIEVAVNDSSDEDMNEDMDDIPPTQVVPDPESSATALPDGKEESEYDMYTPEDKKLPLYPNPEMEAEKTAKRATQKSLKNKKAFEEIPSEGFDSSVSLETMEEELARLMEQRTCWPLGLFQNSLYWTVAVDRGRGGYYISELNPI